MRLLLAFLMAASASAVYGQNLGDSSNLGNAQADVNSQDNQLQPPALPQQGSASAMSNDSGGANNHQSQFNQTQPMENQAGNLAHTQPMGNQAANSPDWRYRFYNGEWWYWTPQNNWMFYRGSQWNRYDAGSFQPLVQSTPTFSNGYSNGYNNQYYGSNNYGRYNNRNGNYGYGNYGYGNGYGRGYGNGPYNYGTGYRGYGQNGYGYNPYFSGNSNVRTGAVIGGAVGGQQGAFIGGAIGGATGGGGRGGRGGRW